MAAEYVYRWLTERLISGPTEYGFVPNRRGDDPPGGLYKG